MSFIEWKTEWSIGIDVLDAQHQEWLGILNDLYESMADGRDKEMLGGILDRLISYCGWHFAEEEQMMRETGYPGFAEHQIRHNELTEKIFTYQFKLEHGLDLGLSVETLVTLRTWITEHILGTDRFFADFLKSRMGKDAVSAAS